MIRTIQTLLLFILSVSHVKSQSDPVLHWARTIGSIGNESAEAVVHDAQGNAYLTGYFNATVDFDPGPGVFELTAAGNGSDGYLLKLDAQGDFVWAKRMGGSQANGFYRISFAPNGDLLLAGSYMGTVDFNPGAGTYNLTSTTLYGYPNYQSFDIAMVRLTADGGFVWAKSFGSSQSDSVLDMVTDASGNILITGIYSYTGDFDPGPGTLTFTATGAWDAFLVKLDADGALLWGKTFGSGLDVRINAVETDADANVYLAGNYYNTVDADPGAGEHLLLPGPADNFGQTAYQGMVIKLNASGEFVWAGKMGGLRATLVEALTVAADQQVYLSGNFTGEVDLDPTGSEYLLDAGTLNNLPANSFFLTRLHADGSHDWSRHFPPSVAYPRLLQTDGDELVVAGTFQDILTLDPTTAITSQGNRDIFLARFDGQGNALWVRSFGGPELDEVGMPEFDASGIWYLPGYFGATADLDPNETVANFTAAGFNDAFLLRFGPEELGVDESGQTVFCMYPNPTDGAFSIRMPLEWTSGEITIYDMNGRLLQSTTVFENVTPLFLASGTYLVQVRNGETLATGKLLVR